MNSAELCACSFISSDDGGGVRVVGSHHRSMDKGATIGAREKLQFYRTDTVLRPFRPPSHHSKVHTPIHMRKETSAWPPQRCMSESGNRGEKRRTCIIKYKTIRCNCEDIYRYNKM
ncbi:unnamed protein product [Macrosiphum euphorbiae]|uniref:Uncharacterized protein n=1 Tax=Macrosiphum euphorbiae TaxID=13131 RepID=A0AAV0WAA4_9HEMI|nr:unnamed protein product [Macrosiphum euphorbiae]